MRLPVHCRPAVLGGVVCADADGQAVCSTTTGATCQEIGGELECSLAGEWVPCR